MNLLTINLLLQLKNASLVKKEFVEIKYSKSLCSVLNLLYKETLIQSFKVFPKQNKIIINLRYFLNSNAFQNLKIISSPSHIVYLKYENLITITEKKKIFFFSTNKGLKNNLDCKKAKIGGKILFSL